MARQTIRTTTRTRVRQTTPGYRRCNICHGTGIVKVGKKKR